MTAPNRSGWPLAGRTPRPFDLAPLARVLGIRLSDTHGLAQAVGINRRWVRRYRLAGLTELQADRWATRCGFHPLDIWPDWPDGPVSPSSGEHAGQADDHATGTQAGAA